MKTVKKLVFRTLSMIALFVFISLIYVACDPPDTEAPYDGSIFSDVWGKLTSDPYDALPHYEVTVSSFVNAGTNYLLNASERTLSDHSDLLPYFDKLVHPNGMCFSGTWRITEDNPYTGYFEKGKQALIIVRASVALSETEKGNYRGFGFAGKIFPTTDPNEIDLLKTANFFAIDNLSGTLADHYLDAVMTNEPDAVSPATSTVLRVAFAAARTFNRADTNPGIRQLYEISELGMADPADALTPQWMKIEATPNQIRVDKADFRDELVLDNYPGGRISFDISVTTPDSTQNNKTWLRIGKILLTDYTVSQSCDHCLHFHHPVFKQINTQ